jgi:HEAT repeat protein
MSSEQTDGMTPGEAVEYKLYKAVQALVDKPLSYLEFEKKILPIVATLKRMEDWDMDDYDRADAAEALLGGSDAG